MKIVLMLLLASVAWTSHAGESVVKIGTNVTVLVENTNQYFRLLVPAKWTLSVEKKKGEIPVFPLTDSTNGPVFTIVVTPKDKPVKCGCGFPHAIRLLHDSNGRLSVDFFIGKNGQEGRVHKEDGDTYFVDIHVDLRAAYSGDRKIIIDAVIDSLEVK